MGKILKYEDILRLETLLDENEFSDYDFKVVIGVDDKETINKINEDFFYKLALGDTNKLNVTDKVDVSIGNREYVYEVKE